MRTTTTILSALALAAAASAQAADLQPPEPAPVPAEVIDTSGWRAQLTAYAWLPSLDGTIALGDGLPVFHESMSRSDILKDLNGAFFLNGSLRRDRFVILGDFTWSSVSKDGILPTPIGNLGIEGKVDALFVTALAGYSVIEQPAFTLDLAGGARAWRLKASVDVAALDFRGSKTNSWVEPIIAARARWQFAPDWSLIGYVDAGGSDIGKSRTWQLYGTVNYRVNDQFYVSAGWRHLSLRYRDGSQSIDTDLSGPLIGATYRF